MRLVQRLEIDGRPGPLASARVYLALNAVGHGVFEVDGDWRGTEGRPARFLLGRGGARLYPLLAGTVTEAQRLSASSTRLERFRFKCFHIRRRGSSFCIPLG